MATSAFKSTSQRTPVGISSSSSSAAASTGDSFSSNRTSSAQRRSRSLSRFSRPLYAPADDFSDDPPAPKGRFVNTVRGSGLPDVTLDDLAVKFFGSADRGRSASRNDDVSPGEKIGSVSQRRGRSVSRHGSRVGEGKGNVGNSYGGGGGRLNSEYISRRRRSVSVVRCQISDSESDLDLYQKSNNGGSLRSTNGKNNQAALANTTTVSNPRQGLRRSLSQKDLKYHDGYSTHSSVITDDEGRDAPSNINGTERTIRTVYTQKKAEHPIGDDLNSGLFEVMRKELRNAVKDIRMDLERGMRKPNASILATDDCSQPKISDAVRAVSMMKRNYATKLEMSDKRKQELLAEMLLEEQRGRELSKIVKELLVDAKDSVEEKPIRTRKRSKDRNRMSQRLNKEAEKYFEDFISNVEDTDISSLDGERSDTSSSIGGITKTQIFQSPVLPKSVPVEMDGVVLPWLKWETSNDSSPLTCTKLESKPTPTTALWEATQETTSNHSVSSRGSWSPGVSHSINMEELTKNGLTDHGSHHSQISCCGTTPHFDVDDYLSCQSEEDFLLERWRQQQSIHSGKSEVARDVSNDQKLKELNAWLPETNSRHGNWWCSAFHNVTAMVGAGFLGLPYAMSQLGWGPGAAILILSWITTLYTLWQMVEMHEMVEGKRFDRYHELGQHAVGEKLRLWIVIPIQLMVDVGSDIAYMVTGGKSLKKFHDTVCPNNCKEISTTYFRRNIYFAS